MTALAYDRYFIDFYICLVSVCSHHVSGSSMKSTGCSYRCQNIFVYFSHSLKTGMPSSLVKKKTSCKKEWYILGMSVLIFKFNSSVRDHWMLSYACLSISQGFSYNPKRITKLCCAEKVFYYCKCNRWLVN